MKCKKKLYFW